MKYYNKILKFMYGRYGIDDLYYFLFLLYILLFFINLFIKNNIIEFIQLFIIFIVFYRFFSKNIYKRRNENMVYLKYKNIILKRPRNIIKSLRRNRRDRYEYVYKRCKKCKKTLKLPIPYDRGIKKVKCPSCNYLNRFYIFKKQKIEVIRRSD